MPNSHHPPDTTRQCSLCRVKRCELSRLDRPTSAFCIGVRPAVAPAVLRRPTHSDAERTCPVVGPTQFTPPHQTRQDGPVCVVSGVNWTIALNVFRLQIFCRRQTTVLSCRESSSHRRSGRDTDKIVLSCLVWRCELALTEQRWTVVLLAQCARVTCLQELRWE